MVCPVNQVCGEGVGCRGISPGNPKPLSRRFARQVQRKAITMAAVSASKIAACTR